MAPEVSRDDATYGPQCDLWSVGVITHELVSGHPPYMARSAIELFENIRKSPEPAFREEVWKQVSKECKNLTRALLLKSPSERPSAKEALQYDWFAAAPDD